MVERRIGSAVSKGGMTANTPTSSTILKKRLKVHFLGWHVTFSPLTYGKIRKLGQNRIMRLRIVGWGTGILMPSGSRT